MSTSDLQRRRYEPMRDYDRVLAMQRVSWEINFAGSSFSEPAFRSALAKGQRRGSVYVYELGGDVVAWLWLDFGVPREAHVRQLQVDEAHWGQGIGRHIMEDAVAIAMARGCRAMTLRVTKSNARAMALYTSLGFTVAEDNGARQRMRLELPKAPAAATGA